MTRPTHLLVVNEEDKDDITGEVQGTQCCALQFSFYNNQRHIYLLLGNVCERSHLQWSTRRTRSSPQLYRAFLTSFTSLFWFTLCLTTLLNLFWAAAISCFKKIKLQRAARQWASCKTCSPVIHILSSSYRYNATSTLLANIFVSISATLLYCLSVASHFFSSHTISFSVTHQTAIIPLLS